MKTIPFLECYTLCNGDSVIAANRLVRHFSGITCLLKCILCLLLLPLRLLAQDQSLAWSSPPIAEVEEVSWSPAGDKIASAGWDGLVRIWNAEDGTHLTAFSGHTIYGLPIITTVQWSHKGDRIASGTYREIIIWNGTDGSILKRIPNGDVWNFSARWSPNDSLLACECNGVVSIFNSSTWEKQTSILLNTTNPGGIKACVSWLNDSVIFGGSTRGGATIFNVSANTRIWAMPLLIGNVGFYDIALSADKRSVWLASQLNVYLFDVDSLRLVDTMRVSSSYLWALKHSPVGEYIAVSGNYLNVKILDVNTGKTVGIIPFPADTFASSNRSLAWSPDGRQIAVGTHLTDGSGRVTVWNLDDRFITASPTFARERDLSFSLLQNYPNPFNPSTTIRFDLPVKSRVDVTVFNVLGQKVAELANEEMVAGSHERIWNASVASGMYFYRIDAVSVTDPNRRFVDVKKMILLK